MAAKARAVEHEAVESGARLPLLPASLTCFQSPEQLDPEALLAELRDEVAARRAETELNPFGNPIRLLALDLGRRLDAGGLSLAAIEQLIQRLTAESFLRRADRLGRYLGESDEAANRDTIRGLIQDLARDPKTAEAVPFETFRRRVESERFGIVITAHPTFALAGDLRVLLCELALADGGDPGGRQARLAEIGQREHRPDRPLHLAEEHRQSLDALVNLHGALHQVYDLVFEVAAELYPERWTELSPRLVTFASWVGYDLDGRSDIPWTATFAKRLKVQVLQLERYRGAAQALRLRATAGAGIADLLELLDARLALAIKQAEDEMAIFADPAAGSEAWREQLARAARAMHAGRNARLVDAGQLLDLIERAIRLADDAALTRGLCILRAEIGTHGLGLAHTHTRLNARQVHNAIRKTIGMDHSPDDPSHRLSYLHAIAALIDRVAPVRINFGSLLLEKATAKRTFMIIAQLLKYVDATQPIRFLIAECETGFTLLTALYFAKLFGVEDKVEISPLFETQVALEQGGRVIAEALGVASYRAYVERQGRLCVQTGYSDAGRSLGQVGAAYAIERLRLTIGRELARQGLSDVELLIFDTHGESIGRGGHPESFAARLDYIDPPAGRAALMRLGIPCKQEVSFQGGDGYVYFSTPRAAFTALTRILEHALTPPLEADDPFYGETDYVHEFFAVVQSFNQRIMDDPCYGALLSAFGANLLHRSGSRPVKRQHDSWSGQINLDHPAQLRAIPHNAILQQLGHLANSIGGVGQAVAKDPERFQRLYQESPRFRRLMTMVEHAFKYSDLAVLKAYIDLFDPGLWLLRAAQRGEGMRAEELQELAVVMERAALHERLTRIWRIFTRDYMDLANAFREHRRRTRKAGAEPIAVDATSRDVMHVLHALRIVLIERLYLLAIHVPEFSGRHELTRESLIARLIQLDVDAALAKLDEIFPVVDLAGHDEDFGEPATYESAESQS
ncbi:MAG TPA: phosphoenolpyruvate carboxylase, partial [Geminicoccaceae bacterium]|nr:phosphoenolpyruvate carboxylase [Geminicoccaceae bacterium]